MIQDQLKEFIKRDFIYIMVMLLALIGCLYTIAMTNNYETACNEYWQQQYADCLCTPQPFNQPLHYNILEEYNGTKNTNQNT